MDPDSAFFGELQSHAAFTGSTLAMHAMHTLAPSNPRSCESAGPCQATWSDAIYNPPAISGDNAPVTNARDTFPSAGLREFIPPDNNHFGDVNDQLDIFDILQEDWMDPKLSFPQSSTLTNATISSTNQYHGLPLDATSSGIDKGARNLSMDFSSPCVEQAQSKHSLGVLNTSSSDQARDFTAPSTGSSIDMQYAQSFTSAPDSCKRRRLSTASSSSGPVPASITPSPPRHRKRYRPTNRNSAAASRAHRSIKSELEAETTKLLLTLLPSLRGHWDRARQGGSSYAARLRLLRHVGEQGVKAVQALKGTGSDGDQDDHGVGQAGLELTDGEELIAFVKGVDGGTAGFRG